MQKIIASNNFSEAFKETDIFTFSIFIILDFFRFKNEIDFVKKSRDIFTILASSVDLHFFLDLIEKKNDVKINNGFVLKEQQITQFKEYFQNSYNIEYIVKEIQNIVNKVDINEIKIAIPLLLNNYYEFEDKVTTFIKQYKIDEANELNQLFIKTKQLLNVIKNIRTFVEKSFKVNNNFWLLFEFFYKDFDYVFNMKYRDKYNENMYCNNFLFYCIYNNIYEVLNYITERYINYKNANLKNKNDDFFNYIEQLFSRKINENCFLYFAFYFEKIWYQETSKKENDVKKFFKYMSIITIGNSNLLETLFFNSNTEKLSCFDLILEKDTYQNLLYYILNLSKSFSTKFFNSFDKDKNNCLYVAALNKSTNLYNMLVDKILEEKSFDYINITNSELKSSIDVIVLNNNDFIQFNLLIKKLKGKLESININTETYITLIENMEKVDKINDVNNLIKSKLKFNSLMKKMAYKNSEFLAKRLLEFIDYFVVEMNKEAFEVFKIIYEYKWSENFLIELFNKLFEISKNTFSDYERFLHHSLEIYNENIAVLFLDFIAKKSKKYLITWNCVDKLLIVKLIERKWWLALKYLLDIVVIEISTPLNNSDSRQKKSSNDSRGNYININIENTENKDEEIKSGIIFKSIEPPKNPINPTNTNNDENNNSLKYSFFYLDLAKEDFQLDKKSNEYKKFSLSDKHPLASLAKTGKHDLIDHEATRQLLKLKWRWWPRTMYYAFTMLYAIFMSLFVHYSFDHMQHGVNMSNLSSNTSSFANNNQYKYSVFAFLFLLITFFGVMEIAQVIDNVKFSPFGIINYLYDLKNVLELFTLVFSIVTLCLSSTAFSSITILCGSLVLILRLEKMKYIGKYSVAFRRTIKNSAKLFPIFIIIWISFLYSFRIRSSFDIAHYNETFTNSLIRTLTMTVGDYKTTDMGVESGDHIAYNIIIYGLFIVLMIILFSNLFVAVAVGELKAVLKEAKIFHLCLRIEYAIHVEKVLTRIGFSPYFMNFGKYDSDSEFFFVKIYHKFWKNISRELDNQITNR